MIAIIDYGAGNTRSVMNALDRMGAAYVLTSNKGHILSADRVILPGVGHAGAAMTALRDRDLIGVIHALRRPFLGVCVGMQLLYQHSEEGATDCLGVVAGIVRRFRGDRLIIPQMGWHTLQMKTDAIFAGVDRRDMMYSVHSYRADVTSDTIGISDYGGEYAAAVKKDNYYGVQFHPEKSSTVGAQILRNFIAL